MHALSKLALVGAFASSALAHGTVTGFVTDGTYNTGWLLQYYYSIANGQSYPATAGWYAENLDNGFIDGTEYAASNIICHKNAKNSNTTATVAAGGTVDFEWSSWPASHIGPIFTYVAKCSGDCSTVDKTTLKWVKIDEAAIDISTQTWPTTTMIANNNTWSTTVPSTLAAGNYVFRHEIIAMHGAGSLNGAQNYPQCMNIAITGSGTDEPEGTLGTALYTNTDPGIYFNPYTTLSNYTIPGPALYSGASSGSGSGSTASTSAAKSSAAVATGSAKATTSAAATKATSAAAGAATGKTIAKASTTKAATSAAQVQVASSSTAAEAEESDCPADDGTETTAAAVATTFATATKAATGSGSAATGSSSSSSGGVALYGQCGGSGYTGSTTCASGTCTVQNDYYSQCL